ncbi:hypothetical protein ACHAWC_006216 [Mediolabrus comicus]
MSDDRPTTSAKRECGRGGRGRGRGRGGSSSGGGRGRGHQSQQKTNQQRQTQQNQKQRGGRGRGGGRSEQKQKQRPRSLSNHYDKSHEYYLAKKSIEGPYAHLFCSQRHGFALSRTLARLQIEEQDKNSSNGENAMLKLINPNLRKDADDRITSAQLEMWWDTVKVVRCHAPMDEKDSSSFERCPICLDEDMTTPYIAPCGHSFCLPCVLGYLNAVATDLNAESERLHKNKQSSRGSGIVGNSGCSDVLPSATITCVRARCPMCSSGSSTVLNAGEPILTYKDLRPLVFVPVISVKASLGERRATATKMKFVKLHRNKGCAAPYLPLESHRVRGSHSMQLFPDLPDGDDDPEESVYARQYFVGLTEMSSLLEREISDLNAYRKQPYEHQQHIKPLFVQVAKSAETQEESQEVEADGKSKSKKSSLLGSGTSYLQRHESSHSPRNENDDFLYYQSCDGQLCFLSGLDVACLMHEFSLYNEDGTDSHDRSKMPLPDEIFATVIASEDEVLTYSLLKRKRFLSHYPLNTTVSFVELDWHSGGEGGNKPLLSQRTLSKFRDEMHHRKSERIRLVKKEDKADRAARKKSEKMDRQRRIELFGNLDSFDRQTIDPDDEFFQAVAVSSDEVDANATPSFSFNQVCLEGGVFPELSTMSSSPPKQSSSWGRNNHQSPHSPKITNFPSLSESMSLDKKSKNKSTPHADKVNRWGVN